MFVGREDELKELESRFLLKKSQLIVVYGRRRIGKSELLKNFCKNKDTLFFEGLESGQTKIQISALLKEFSRQVDDPFIKKLNLSSWPEVLDLLTDHLKKQRKLNKKTVIVLDEFQWLACQQTRLVSLLKFYWDNHWKPLNTMMILCGSVAHFMVKRVLKSQALYGRVNWELPLSGLKPSEARKMILRRGDLESLKYLLIFGAIPKYLEEINQNKSLEENINRLCFTKGGFFVTEVEKIFFSQFREAQTYKKIIEVLTKKNKSLAELSQILNIPSGGGLKSYLDNLQNAGFIRPYTSIQQKGRRQQKYKLFDEYLNFYFKFMLPYKKQIEENEKQKLFSHLIAPHWKPWLGIAFEVFCLKQAMFIAEKSGFAHEVTSFGPLFSGKEEKFQIDLIFQRTNKVKTICEIKFHESPLGTSVIPEVERKIKLLPKTRGETIEKMLISPFGADESLRQAEYFHHIISMKDFFFSKM